MRPLLTNKLLILNSILLVFVLALLIFLNYSDIKYKFNPDSSYSYGPDSEDNEEVTVFQKQDTIEVDTKGLKNATISLPEYMIQAIATELDSVNWNQVFAMEDLYDIYHETVFARQFPSDYGPGESWLVITYTNAGSNHCHACTGRISLFEFRKNNDLWTMVRKYPAFGYGDEDALEPRGFELVQIGINSKYGLITHTGYSNMGHDQETKSVYTEVNDSLKLVFDFKSYEYYNEPSDDVEYTDGYSSMRILKSNKAYFDIETKSEGIEWSDKTSVNRFVFDGKEYVETK